MRKVVAYEFLSLDGVAEQPDEFVTELKQQSGNDIGVHGSIALTQSLLEHGLVDELRLVIAPVLQIKGRKLFDEGVSRRLSLTRNVTSPSGHLLLDYRVG